MKSLYVAIQDHDSRKWSPVARVRKQGDLYRLNYTGGAKELAGFKGFGLMKSLDKEYVSNEIFPLLKNRVLASGRPESKRLIYWLGLGEGRYDAFEELARTGGVRATDTIELIPEPEPTSQNRYEAYFFVRGVRHLPPTTEDIVNRLQVGDRLYLLKDIQNDADPYALLLRTKDPISVIGYAPRYYSEDFSILASGDDVKETCVTVEQINRDAPLAYRILCKINAPWPKTFSPCATSKFTSLASGVVDLSCQDTRDELTSKISHLSTLD